MCASLAVTWSLLTGRVTQFGCVSLSGGSTELLTPFWQGIHSIRAAMRAQLYEKFTQREAWRRIRHSPGHNLTGASLFFGIDTPARSQFSGDRWADCVLLSPPPQPDITASIKRPSPSQTPAASPSSCHFSKLLITSVCYNRRARPKRQASHEIAH